jgi:transaldolase
MSKQLWRAKMKHPIIFLDTADVDEIREAISTGIVDGIATNPEKIAASGKSYRRVVEEIRRFFDGPVAVQAIGKSTDEIVRHALSLHRISENLAVKITCNIEGIRAIRELVGQGVKTNCTLMYSATQGLAAGLAGSPFVSPFVGRAESAGYDGIEVIRQIRRIYDEYDIPSIIIAASIKNVRQVTESIIAGAHAVAVRWPIFREMINHPITEFGYADFEKIFHDIPPE